MQLALYCYHFYAKKQKNDVMTIDKNISLLKKRKKRNRKKMRKKKEERERRGGRKA